MQKPVVPLSDYVIIKFGNYKFYLDVCFARYDYKSPITIFIIGEQAIKNNTIISGKEYLNYLNEINKEFKGIVNIKQGTLGVKDCILQNEPNPNSYCYDSAGLKGYFITVDPEKTIQGEKDTSKLFGCKLLLMLIRALYDPKQWNICKKAFELYESKKFRFSYVQLIFLVTQLYYTVKNGGLRNTNHWIIERYPQLDNRVFDINKYKPGLGLTYNLENCSIMDKRTKEYRKLVEEFNKLNLYDE